MRKVGSRNEGVQLALQESGEDVCVTTNGNKYLILNTTPAFLKPDSWPNPRRTATGPSPRTEPRALGDDVCFEKDFREDEDSTYLVKKRKDDDENIKILNATLHEFFS